MAHPPKCDRAESSALTRLDEVAPESSSGAEIQVRFSHISAMARAALARADSRHGYYAHLLLQYERAKSQHDVSRAAERLLQDLRQELTRENFDVIDRKLNLADYPWQRGGFRHFTEREAWCRRYRAAPGAAPHMAVLHSPGEVLVPYVPDGEPVVYFFSGNRQAYVGKEHEPASRFFGQELAPLAEAYVARAASCVWRLLASDDDTRMKIVTPAYAALDSRHEQRLIHFALSRDPSFVHPSIEPVADEIARLLLLRRAADGSWLPKTERELAATPRFRAVTHSYGSSAVVQCITHIVKVGEIAGLSRESLTRYFARGSCVQLGGYRLDMRTEISPSYHCVISLLDQIALGSPGPEPRYTSPLTPPRAAWDALSRDELNALVSGELEQVPIGRHQIASKIELWTPALPEHRAYDATGHIIAEFESANGHHLAAYTACLEARLGQLVEELRRD